MNPERVFSGTLSRAIIFLFAVVWAAGLYAPGDARGDEGPSLHDIQVQAEEIDKFCDTPDGESMVRQNLMHRFAITDERITELRNMKMGYGEIGILHSLSDASGRDTAELLQMRTEQKMGWGNIAKHVDVSMGQAVSGMKGLERQVDKPLHIDGPEKSLEKGMKPQKTGRPEKTARPERGERPMKPGKSGK